VTIKSFQSGAPPSSHNEKNPRTIDRIGISAEWHKKSDENSWCLFAEFSEGLRGEIQKKCRGELALQPILCLNQYINPKFIFFLDHIHVIIDEKQTI